MPPPNLLDFAMPVITNRHRQFHLLPLNLSVIKTWLLRQHVIQRRQVETSPCPPPPQENADILGVTIGRAIQPEQNLGFQNVS